MCEYRVGVGVDLINELLRESGEGEEGFIFKFWILDL